MAHFFAAIDPDPVRRAALRDRVIERLRELSHLKIGSVARGDTVAVWAMVEGAPQDLAVGLGVTGVLLGEAMPRGEARRLSAEDLLADWAGAESPADLPRRDGFSVFLHLTEQAIGVQADLLGIFPVYHTVCAWTRMVSSSPWLFGAHPDYSAAVDPEGIVGLLLANSIVAGRTVYRDVRRLEPGAVLVSEPTGGWREAPNYQVPISAEHHHLPVPEMVHHLHAAMDGAVARHLAGAGPSLLLLSGGLDSRLLAGYLSRQRLPITAVTYGLSTDQETRIAATVARSCGLRHHLEAQAGPRRGLDTTIRWEGVPCAPATGGAAPVLSVRGERVVTGYLMDAIVGGSDIPWGYDGASRTAGFAPFMAQLNRWGFDAATLNRLLRRDVFGDAVEAVTSRIREEYHAAGETDLERSWRTDLRYIQRFHVGRIFWRLSNSAWPSAPSVDQEVIAVAGSFPLALLADRQLEIQLLCKRFPVLAQLPIDRNSYDTRAHDPRLRDLVAQDLWIKLRALGEKASFGLWTAPERRYYHRVFDFNAPGWRAARRSLDLDREPAYQVFQREAFDGMVPRAGTTVTGDAIKEASGVKALLAVHTLLKQL